MPAYCGSCPFNKFCKDVYIQDPTCPMGYRPVGLDKKSKKKADIDANGRTGYVLDPAILLKIGKAAMNRNDFETSVACYEKALEIDPNNAEASFLLRRTQFMLKDDSELETDDTEEPTEEELESEEKPSGMLPHQQTIKSIQIKPKQKAEINPNIISEPSEKVYQVQMEETEEEQKEKEYVSKHMAIRSKASVMKSKKGTYVVLTLVVAMILMIVFALWVFGFLDF